MDFWGNRNQQQQQQQSQTGGLQQADQAFRTGGAQQQPKRTENKYKIPLILFWALPVLLFTFFLGVDYDPSFGNLIPGVSGILGGNFGATVGIFFAWVVISQVIVYFLIKKVEGINADMYIYGFTVLGFMAAFYLIPQFQWYNRIWVAFLTAMLGTMIGKGSAMAMVVYKGIKTMKLAKKQMEDLQRKADPDYDEKKASKTKEDVKKEKAEKMAVMMKREQEVLDQMLREQGIDIDALDEQYGTQLDDAFERANTVKVKDLHVEEEVVEVIEVPESEENENSGH